MEREELLEMLFEEFQKQRDSNPYIVFVFKWSPCPKIAINVMYQMLEKYVDFWKQEEIFPEEVPRMLEFFVSSTLFPDHFKNMYELVSKNLETMRNAVPVECDPNFF